MRARLITAALGIPLFIGALVLGDIPWLALMLLTAVAGAAETARLASMSGARPFLVISAGLACALVVQAYLLGGDGSTRWAAPVSWATAAAALLFVGHGLWPRVERQGLPGVGATLAAAVYPGLFVAHLVALRQIGLFPALLAVLCTWATDTAAFFAGTLAGKRALWPSVSPNKTVEGALGGLLGGAATAGILGSAFGMGFWVWAGVGLIVSLAAQLGDLVESGLKRRAGVKDSGALLPGHGGVLDRVDSLLFAGVAVYYVYALMG